MSFPVNLLNMEIVLKEVMFTSLPPLLQFPPHQESADRGCVVVMELDELEKRLSKGFRVYKKIHTTMNLKDEWEFKKLKILFMRQYSQLFFDCFEPTEGYFYLEKAREIVEKQRKLRQNAKSEDLQFYRYLVEIDRTNYFVSTDQYDEMLK